VNAPADPREEWLAALAWQVELGADEAIGEAPLDRFAEMARAGAGGVAGEPVSRSPRSPAAGDTGSRAMVPARPPSRPLPGTESGEMGVANAASEDARAMAEAAETLDELAEAIRGWSGSPLREAARNMVFCDGVAGARLMVIGEAPGGEEDRVGKPFVGRAGQLLDRMLAAIGLARTAPAPEQAVYITNILPWRPPGNRTPSEAEARQFLPFVERHIALARPDIIMAVGNTPTKALLGTVTGIKRMRGSWARHEPSGLPLMPCFHPAYLLRTPEDKRLAWRDLVAVRRALDGEAPLL
jgi:uracil-DNA glycosylase